MAITSSLVLVGTASTVLADTEYHHNGAKTTARYDGAYAYLEVTNPTVRPNTGDFVANRIFAKKLASPGAGQQWLEVGWAEVGWEGLVGGVPEQYVYTYTSADNDWHYHGALCVSAGCHVDVRIVPGAGCDIGDPTCLWTAQLFNHPTGTWDYLRLVTLGMDRAYLEEMTEIYIDPTEPWVGHPQVDQVSNDLDWFQTQRRYADGTWHDWTSSNSSAQAKSPYCIDWISTYDVFEAQNGGC